MDGNTFHVTREILLNHVHDILKEHPNYTDEQIEERVLTQIPSFKTHPLHLLMITATCGMARSHIGMARQEHTVIDVIRANYDRKRKNEPKEEITIIGGLTGIIKALLEKTPNASAQEIKNQCYELTPGFKDDTIFQLHFDNVYMIAKNDSLSEEKTTV